MEIGFRHYEGRLNTTGACSNVHTQDMEQTLMHAFERTWDRVYATFRKQYHGPAAELAAEEAYRRLATTLQTNEYQASARALVHVGDLLEDIVTDMLSPEPSMAKGTIPHATMRKSA
jgi:hypothetical protein